MSTTVATSWWPVDLRPIIDGADHDPPPVLLARTDGPRLLYAEKIHSLHGEPESLKSWAANVAVAETIRAGGHAMYLDFEDTPRTMVARLRALGVHVDLIAERAHYIRPAEAIDDAARVAVETVLEHHAPNLVVIDGVNEALGVFGLDLASNSDYARFLEALPRPLARSGAAVAMIDHVGKSRENRGRGAIGAQHKLAGIDVAYSFEVAAPFGRGLHGIARIGIDKDRPGHVRAVAESGKRAGELHLVSDPETGLVAARIEPARPVGARSVDTSFRPTGLMERVSRYLELRPEGTSKTKVENDVSGKAEYLRLAVECLIAEGFASAEPGARNAVICRAVKPFREAEQ